MSGNEQTGLPLWPSRGAAEMLHSAASIASIFAAVATVGAILFPVGPLDLLAAIVAVLAMALAFWMGQVKDAYQAKSISIAAEGTDRLREQLAPRRLSSEKKLALAGLLLSHRGQKYDIIFFLDDKESLDLANDINQALTSAGWVLDHSKEFLGFAVVENIKIEWAPSKQAEFSAVAGILARALNTLGLAAEIQANPEQERFADRIRVKVGKKAR